MARAGGGLDGAELGACREVSDWFLAGTAPSWGCGGLWNSLPGVAAPPKLRWPWSRP